MTENLIALLANTIFYAVVLIVSLILGAFTLNNLPMGDKPGFIARLKHYLTSNVAKTEINSIYPELELPTLAASPRLLLTRIERAMVTLGWDVASLDNTDLTVDAVIQSAVLRFKDDLSVKLVPVNQIVEIHIISTSRVGRGDLGTNTRHILNLLQAIDRQIEIET